MSETKTVGRVIELISGYDRTKNPVKSKYRVIGLDEVKSWAIHQPTPCTCVDGTRTFTIADEDHMNAYNQMHDTTHQVGDTFTLHCGNCEGSGTLYRDITPSHVCFVAMD